MSKRKYSKSQQKNIAKNRIKKIFKMAEKAAHSDRLYLANRYVQIARKISMRYVIPIPKEYKRRFCKHCYHYLIPSVTCRIRIHRKKIITYCDFCKKISRFPIK